MTTYLLWGYWIPPRTDAENNPCCLLYDTQLRRFKIKSLPPLHKKVKGPTRLRACFKNTQPPFPFTWVKENVFTGEITATTTPSEAGPKWRASREMEATIVPEEDIDNVLFNGAPTMMASGNQNLSMNTRMTEAEYVLTHGIKQSLLRHVRVQLIRYLDLTEHVVNVGSTTRVFYLPTDKSLMFLQFERVDPHGKVCDYPSGPDYNMRRHKIIKHVYEEMCPFARAVPHGAMSQEMALSMCLPAGSANFGWEIFYPERKTGLRRREVYTASHVTIRADDFSIRSSDDHVKDTRDVEIPIDCSGGGREFLSWRNYALPSAAEGDRMSNDTSPVSVSDPEETDDDDDEERFHDPQKQIKFIASMYCCGETDEFFRKGAVVFYTNQSTAPFSTVDFSNFYANVAIRFRLDPYVSKVLMKMTSMRQRVPELKQWIVALIGKSKHIDPLFYNRLKALSVAVVLATIEKNGDGVVGATTDGVLLDAIRHKKDVRHPAGFPIKEEFVPEPSRGMLTINPNQYVGVSRDDGSVSHRGFIGRFAKDSPSWYRDIVTVVLKHCLKTPAFRRCVPDAGGKPPASMRESKEVINNLTRKMTAELKAIMVGKQMRDYVLPNSYSNSPCTVVKRTVMEYYINDLVVDDHQYLTEVDDYLLPSWCKTDGSRRPISVNGYCIKKMNVAHYVENIRNKLEKVAKAFYEYQGCVALCTAAFKTVKRFVHTTLRNELTVYPGAVGGSTTLAAVTNKARATTTTHLEVLESKDVSP